VQLIEQAWVESRDVSDDGLVLALDELWQRRIVTELGVSAYNFSHDLLREVAYARIAPARRRLLHRRVAHALERLYGADVDSTSAQIAAHFQQAGDNQQAIIYYQRASEVVLRLFAYHDAIGLLERGMALVHTLPASPIVVEYELELQMALCTAWAAITSYLGKEVALVYDRALELCRQVRQSPHLFTVLWGLHEVALYRADYDESLALAKQCLAIATELGDPDLLLQAHHAAWGPYCFLGDYDKAFEHIDVGLAIYDCVQHEPLSVY
jgi:predicted ATPase